MGNETPDIEAMCPFLIRATGNTIWCEAPGRKEVGVNFASPKARKAYMAQLCNRPEYATECKRAQKTKSWYDEHREKSAGSCVHIQKFFTPFGGVRMQCAAYVGMVDCGHLCPRYTTRKQAVQSKCQAYARLRGLPTYKQDEISKKYFNGRKPWSL